MMKDAEMASNPANGAITYKHLQFRLPILIALISYVLAWGTLKTRLTVIEATVVRQGGQIERFEEGFTDLEQRLQRMEVHLEYIREQVDK